MGNVMSVQYKAVKVAFPWLTGAIPYFDQCGDYRSSTSATIFNHEMGRLTELRVKLVLHSEVGSGKGEVDMHFGQKGSRPHVAQRGGNPSDRRLIQNSITRQPEHS